MTGMAPRWPESMARIANEGMGGFLDPPEYPSHNFSLVWPNGSCSLDHALKHGKGVFPDTVLAEAENLVKLWKNGAYGKVPNETWVLRILGYFKDCYRDPADPGGFVVRKIEPMENLDEHCGIRFIRKFYPDFVPTKEQFENAGWGK